MKVWIESTGIRMDGSMCTGTGIRDGDRMEE